MPQQPASSISTRAAGMRPIASAVAPGRASALVWQCGCTITAASSGFSRGVSQRSSASSKSNTWRETVRASSSPGSSFVSSSRSVRMHDGSRPTMGTPLVASGNSRRTFSTASCRASSSMPAEM